MQDRYHIIKKGEVQTPPRRLTFTGMLSQYFWLQPVILDSCEIIFTQLRSLCQMTQNDYRNKCSGHFLQLNIELIKKTRNEPHKNESPVIKM